MLARPEIGSKPHIRLWVGSKDPNEEYDWSSYFGCACGQYSKENGEEHGWVNGLGELNRLAEMQPRTFGALYERASMAWFGAQ